MRELLAAALAETEGVVLVDMEASIEHMRRATVRHVDLLLVVTEPYYRSLESAGRLVRLARELGIPKIVAVANKVRTSEEEEALRQYTDKLEVEVVAVVPFDANVTAADMAGKAVLDGWPDSPAVQALDGLSKWMTSDHNGDSGPKG